MSIKVDVHDEQLEAFTSTYPARMTGVFGEWRRQGQEKAFSVLQENTPVRSGFLKNSIQKKTTENGFIVYPTAPYTRIVEEGSKPNTIFPSNGKFLVFRSGSLGWAFGEGTIFARHVKHPGFPGRFFIKKSGERLREDLRELFLQIWSRMFQ